MRASSRSSARARSKFCSSCASAASRFNSPLLGVTEYSGGTDAPLRTLSLWRRALRGRRSVRSDRELSLLDVPQGTRRSLRELRRRAGARVPLALGYRPHRARRAAAVLPALRLDHPDRERWLAQRVRAAGPARRRSQDRRAPTHVRRLEGALV